MPWWQSVDIGPLSYRGSQLLRGHLYWRWWPTKSAVFPCHAMMAGGRHWTTQLAGQPPAQGSPLLKVMAQLRVLFSNAMMALDHSAIRAGTGVTFIEGVGPTKRAVFPCHDGSRWTLDHSAIGAANCSGVTFIEGDGQLRVLFSHAMPWWQEVDIGPLS